MSTGMLASTALAMVVANPLPSDSCFPNLLRIRMSRSSWSEASTNPTACSSAALSSRQPRDPGPCCCDMQTVCLLVSSSNTMSQRRPPDCGTFDWTTPPTRYPTRFNRRAISASSVSVSASPECWIAAKLAPLHELACEDSTTVFHVPNPRFAAMMGTKCPHDIDLKQPQSQASRSSQLLKDTASRGTARRP